MQVDITAQPLFRFARKLGCCLLFPGTKGSSPYPDLQPLDSTTTAIDTRSTSELQARKKEIESEGFTC